MRISDWSSDVCSSDLARPDVGDCRGGAGDGGDEVEAGERERDREQRVTGREQEEEAHHRAGDAVRNRLAVVVGEEHAVGLEQAMDLRVGSRIEHLEAEDLDAAGGGASAAADEHERSEEHTSELQSLMRQSYAVFC